MRFFVSVISRDREERAYNLAKSVYNLFSGAPNYQGTVVLQHMCSYPSLSSADFPVVLDRNSDELDVQSYSLGALRNQSIQRGVDRFHLEGHTDPESYVLVLDDDISLHSSGVFTDWSKANQCLALCMGYLNANPDVSMVQLSHKTRPSGDLFTEGVVATTSGGLLIRLSHWEQVGGFGDDYFDTPELSLKFMRQGWSTVRFNKKFSTHVYAREGGLSVSLPGKKNCNEMRHLSRIISNYPDLVVKDPESWLGFVLK